MENSEKAKKDRIAILLGNKLAYKIDYLSCCECDGNKKGWIFYTEKGKNLACKFKARFNNGYLMFNC